MPPSAHPDEKAVGGKSLLSPFSDTGTVGYRPSWQGILEQQSIWEMADGEPEFRVDWEGFVACFCEYPRVES